MTTRKRKSSTRSSESTRRNRRTIKSNSKRITRRQHLLETLESRQLLAGPQLIGIQPNEGALIVDGSQRDTAPRVLTFGFDEAQSIDASTLSGIRITRAGGDGAFNTADDVQIQPGLVTLGDPNENEVVVRFVEALPDDQYRIEVFGFDDDGLNVVGLRNSLGELFVPSDPSQRSETIDFELKLGALIESVVPQPVIRQADGSLTQNRDEIVVYFNEDPLFVENDANGNPTSRSAENPRFYQLLFTQETVRTTDDLLFTPNEVVYDEATHTARLLFATDINNLAGNAGGGTWRLRIGTAVDSRADLIITPTPIAVTASTVTDFQHSGLRVTFSSATSGEVANGISVRFTDSGIGGVTATLDGAGNVVFDFGGAAPVVNDLQTAIANNAAVDAVINMAVTLDGAAGGGNLAIPRSVLGAPPMVFVAVGETLETAFDVGVLGEFSALKSIVLTESIDAKPYFIELPGGQDDPGHTDQVEHINLAFGADTEFGVTEIAYNFQGVFDQDASGNSFLNQITDIQKTRIREALDLWSSEIGVQFYETESDGITFALGDTGDLQNRPGVFARNVFQLDASLRVDPTYNESAMVFSNQVVYGTAYGEDFTRKAVAGIGLMLGLNQSSDLEAPSIMSFDFSYLNASIDVQNDLEPVFPNNVDVLHGQYVHRPDSNDIDLYRFVVDLDDADKQGILTAETFAERLPDSSLLDTTLTLFQEVSASVSTDLGVGTQLAVEFRSLTPGRLGNNAQIEFRPSSRVPGDNAVRIFPAFDSSGTQLPNAVIVDIPLPSNGVTAATAGAVVAAVNNHPLSSSMFRAAITAGDASEVLTDVEARFSPVVLSGGGIEQLNRNDDYFSEDSRIVTQLGEGVYYLGVAASGNNHYDPTIAGSGVGGLTQGDYELQIQFEPQVDEVDVLRDLDNDRVDVPGTLLDGDGDGVPGGVHNFWFQTRPLNRIVNFTDSGDAIVPGQTITVTGANGVVRRFEFVPNGSTPSPGNVAVSYSPGGTGFPTPAGNLASALQASINSFTPVTGVSVSRTIASLEFAGERGIEFSTGFRGATALGRNIFVDKTAGPQADGSLDRPFNNINNNAVANAFGSAIENDIVRIVGNGGLDNLIETEADNFSYKIGVADTGGGTLEDGRNMEVPMGVTTMIDAGAIFKLRNSFIGIGSTTVQIDRSGGALQVLGTPRLVQLSVSGDPVSTAIIADEDVDSPGFDDGRVIFTSIRDANADSAAAIANGASLSPSSGDWGGLVYKRDLDQSQGRKDLEDEGIFLQRVNHADIRYGGGSNVLIDSVQQLVNPIQIVNMRPTITFNDISLSSDSAISAAPNSFEETSYQSPEFQQAGAFRADYDRVGPEIHNNQLIDNSINGLFIRATTTPTERPREFTVAGRFDDIDIVHYVAENLIVSASPGGSVTDGFAPSMSLVSGQALAGGTLVPGAYEYKMTFVDRDGFESLASSDTFTVVVGTTGSSVELATLPQVGLDSEYLSRRLYRSVAGQNDFRLVANLDGSSTGFIDAGLAGDARLDLTRTGTRGRLDASLVMDPGLIVKFRGARIELGHGTQLLAEGLGSSPVVFTSSLDDRFGAGGTFDTNNDNETITGAATPERGDWSGIYAGPTSNVSLDNVQLSYAGGISLLEGGLARGFAALELQQATGRITNSSFEFNDSGQDGAGPVGRLGRLGTTEATIMVRGSQPIIVGNTFTDNRGSIIDIDIESMGGNYRIDTGRETGSIDRLSVLDDNFGPMIRFNRYLNNPDSVQQLSGLEIRGGTTMIETVFDDTDIAHLVFDNIEVGNFHSDGGLRLLSRPDESLVVKFSGEGNANSATFGTGLTASGSVTGASDRIGGAVHVIGLPGAPVILTSLNDDDAGAGLKPDGSQFTDHDGDGLASRPFANDWRGILLDQFSNDTNIPVLPELELSTESAPGLNANIENAQFLGELAADELTSDHVRRLGFEVQGFLAGTNDVDTYSFIGSPGSEVWLDIDRTSLGLNTVIELLDENGDVLARSDDSFAETAFGNPTPITVLDPDLQGLTSSLQARNEQYTERGVGGLYRDFGSTNPYDAGIHFRLAGNTADPSLRSVYFFRVRSDSVDPDNAQGGFTGGGYRLHVRLNEDQQFAGSVVRHADIRYANHGIHIQGLMSSSPLIGEAQENEAVAGNNASNDTPVGLNVGQGGQYVGNLVNNASNVISIGGSLSSGNDVDFYQFDIDYANGGGIQSTIFDIDYAAGFNRPDTNISVFFDGDGVATDNFQPRLIYFGSSSNIADDQTSPGGENNPIEKLLRGSVSNGDPFIGPVALPEGSYFVAVTADGVTPATLAGALREPINSVDRIVEDRIDRLNPESPSTADGPIVPQLFTDAAILASAFSIEVDTAIGHGKPEHVDGSTGPTTFNGAFRYPEFTVANGLDADNDIPTGSIVSANLDLQDWSLDDDFDIGGTGGFFAPELTATTIPHISVSGSLQNDPADIYQFTIPGGFSQRVILDIDGGYNALTEFDDDGDPATPPINTDQSSVDTSLVLLQADPANPGSLIVIQQNDDDFGFGFGFQDGASGSNSGLDPFISTFLSPGTYFVAVLDANTTFTNDANGFITTNGAVGAGSQTYTLHVSVDNHILPPGVFQTNNGQEALSFDRVANTASGSITSEPFDLAGYVPADLPTLYFNRFYQPVGGAFGSGDSATLTITSDQNPGGSLAHVFTSAGTNESWRQVRLSLDDFAGDTGIQLRFDYNTNGLQAGAAETGLRVDDFIVGFAERGETIFNTASNAAFVGTGFGAVSGEYQIELRQATEYATAIGGGQTNLDESFDTNERHGQSVTLVAPDGTQVQDGDTFVIGDGAANQTFEFTSTGAVTFGHTPVLFSATDTPAVIAGQIRNAINSQTVIQIEAASAGGLDSQPTTDGRLILSGSATGTFLPIASAQNAPVSGTPLSSDANGQLLIPAVLHDGVGDSNFLRRQGQVIVEHNKISDVRGIGIWAEPGVRDVDPNDAVDQGFFFNDTIVPGPLGNTYPGAAINLPVLNDSVLGGLAPGIVIQNNTIDNAEYAGIKLDGEIAPWMIIPPLDGDLLLDGYEFAIDAAGTRVVFEFDEIGGGATTDIPAGAATNGGNGVQDGHVPVYIRHFDDTPETPYLNRITAYSQLEIAHAIAESIQGSILMTNGLVELVEVTVGTNPLSANGSQEVAVFVQGASGIYQQGGIGSFTIAQAPVAESVQPFSRVINNTIYGEDGTEAATPDLPAEPNDFLSEATTTNVGNSHAGAYVQNSTLGDNAGAFQGAGDIDFYRVHLNVGDRLEASITTADADPAGGVPEGPSTVLTLFDENGIAIAQNDGGTSANGRDPSFDFSAPKSGVYYVGVSGNGNDDYDTQSFSGRVPGTGGTGAYSISLEAFTPRSFVLSSPGGTGSFTTGGSGNIILTLVDGREISVPIQGSDRVPEIMRATQIAISAALNVAELNQTQDPFGAIGPGIAHAWGASNNVRSTGTTTFIGSAGPGLDNLGQLLDPVDFNTGGFAHDRNNVQTGSTGFGSTELYVFIERVAKARLEGSNFQLDPVDGKDIDQLLNETGVMITAGASPTLLNNVFLNLHESLVVEETRVLGFGTNGRGSDNQPKPMEVIVVGSIFQDHDGTTTLANQGVFFTDPTGRDTGITTSPTVPSNVNGGNDDFNVTLADTDPALQYSEGNNFQPDFSSILIDSSVNSLVERSALVNLRSAVGLPISNVLAPNTDVNGIVRADHPDFAPPGGLGASVFKDRGSSELADFTGPIAIAEVPRDNDAEGIDSDPAISFINLTSGIYEEFQIQLRDNGDSSDPFTGIGVDDASVVVPEIPGLRTPGANVTLFENEVALVEGIDYTFNYDETKNVITLTPLSGIWRNEFAYRIELNNSDQTVLVAPDPSQVSDGSQFSITDSNGGTVVFEFETGFQLLVPEPITLIVPQQGTNAGGIGDGDIFRLDDGINPPVVFEYNADAATLPGTVPVTLPGTITPLDAAGLAAFLNQIALNTKAAIDGEINAGRLDMDVRVIGNQVVIGAESGATASTAGSGLVQAPRTLALEVPAAGSDPVNGVRAGETFVVNDGVANVIFEFIDGTNTLTPGNNPVDITSATPLTSDEVAVAIQNAILLSGLELEAQATDAFVYLNLPRTGTTTVNSGQLRVVGLSRTPVDGDTITFTPDDGTPSIIFEINRTDEPGVAGGDDGVVNPHLPVNITRATTADEFAAAVANAVQSQVISGLSPNDVQVISGGLLTIGGQQGLGLAVSGSSLEVVGSPAVTGASTIQVFGPLLLNMPAVGGGAIQSGEVLLLQDDLGNDVLFEFVLDQAGFTPFFDGTLDANGLPKPVSNVVLFNSFDTNDVIAGNVAAAINLAGIGITAQAIGNGQIDVGRIDAARVNTRGDSAAGIPGTPQITTQRGIVSDQEILTIRQGTTQVNFEFEEATNGGGVTTGNVAVAFQAGSSVGDVANSLAAAINNNAGNLRVFAVAELDDSGNPTGQVILNDIPGTVVDVTNAPTLNVIGVPGGAIPVRISPSFSATDVKQAMLVALNSVNTPGQAPATTLSAVDRGGSTLFVQNGQIFSGAGITSYFLPAIKDLAGNPLKPNRGDTTQFTILMPTTELDYGDAPDPFFGTAGRYPTLGIHDGPRHVADGTLTLGATVDVDLDGRPVELANGDDTVITVLSNSTLFTISNSNGATEILVDTAAAASANAAINAGNQAAVDGDTITIDTGIDQATLEFDLDGIFDEDNFAIRPVGGINANTIATAIVAAINESPLRPASVVALGDTVQISVDDEDGVVLTSSENPLGILNKNVNTPITVTVTGSGVLEGWIDFNADGDWDDAGEQIIGPGTPGSIFSDTGSGVERTFIVTVPPTTPDPPSPTTTYARFRVSRNGGLGPTGLALSGEVEDYAIPLLPGSPPTLTAAQSNRTFTVAEDVALQALDGNGVLTTTANDDGLLAGVVDPDGDPVAILPADVGFRTLQTPNGTVAGVLSLAGDGTFSFVPEPDFNGTASFTARVTDVNAANPGAQIVNITPITVSIEVQPVNDEPFATVASVTTNRTIAEDTVQIFDIAELITPFYSPGPANESSQPMIIQSASSLPDTFGNTVNAASTLGGLLEIINGGTQIRYTPPLNVNGTPSDTFQYIVADQPGAGQVAELATLEGRVTIAITAVNDPPIAGTDRFSTDEDTPLLIPLTGINGIISSNDSVGPANEVVPGQPPVLQTPNVQFPKSTFQGGSVVQVNGGLEYRPPAFFSGDDSFTYTIVDPEGATATGTVLIAVNGQNNAPVFIGINGNSNATSLTFDESKVNPQQFTFDLNTWFLDPESDDLTFNVVSENPALVTVTMTGDELTVVLPSFAFGNTRLVVTASDGSAVGSQTFIPVTVNNTPDPPTRIGTLNPLTGFEDQNVVGDLRSVFADPDGEQLTYTVTRLGNIVNPTESQIADHSLVRSITPSGDSMIFAPEADQFGSVEIEITATDGAGFRVSDTFTLVINPVADTPVSLGDSYSVPVGSFLQILNPASGLLRNDTDADNDPIMVSVASVTDPEDRVPDQSTQGRLVAGQLTVFPDGTFTYLNTDGQVGDVDRFTYQAIDSNGLLGVPVVVSLTLSQSSYQNPIEDEREDVTADGHISPLDVLRVLNFLNVNQSGNVPVGQIGAPPPDFLDVNGDGAITPRDALQVINKLAANARAQASGELVLSGALPQGEQIDFAVTTSYAAASSASLPARNLAPLMDIAELERDSLFSGDILLSGSGTEAAASLIASGQDEEMSEAAHIDDVFTDLSDDTLTTNL